MSRFAQQPTLYQYKAQIYPDFMSRQPPPNYVAGLGRGATGFTTRSDIGPARENVDFNTDKSLIPGGPDGAPPPGFDPDASGKRAGGDNDDEPQNEDPDNETGLFSSLPYEADDEEADRIYEEVDRKMDERRKARREQREREEIQKYRKERPKIQEQFSDLKRALSSVTEDEWANLPEVGDLVRKKTKRNSTNDRVKERFVAVPDSVVLGNAAKIDMNTSIDPMSGTLTEMTDFVQFGQGREKVLGLKLDQISDSVSGQSTIDPKGYLTDLNSVVIKSDAEISDIKKARTLLGSVTTTNPKHAPGWIAAARLEEVAGKMAKARDIIARGCEECSTNEDVWLEAARLNTNDNAKVILANAVKNIPQSVKIWLKAMSLETDVKSQKRVLRRALEFIPNSVKLWKAAVSLEEDPDDARILLSRAVECVPLSIELWLALARLETYKQAQVVLNNARKAIPTSHEIWIAAATLQEANGFGSKVNAIIKKAISDLTAKGSVLEREQWIKEAETCEKNGWVVTCQAIIDATIGMGVEEEDAQATWNEDAESCIAHGSYATARAIYTYALKKFSDNADIWESAAYLEKQHGTFESLDEVLRKAVEYCRDAEVLWLMRAKENWLRGDIETARSILNEAFNHNHNNEKIWLAAVKLEVESELFERAQKLLEKARQDADTPRVWMKSAVLERQLKNVDNAMSLLETALQRFPNFAKLWMIKGQIEENELNNTPAARETYAKGTKQCPKSYPLWILASRLEEKAGLVIKARAVLERARLLNTKIPELWYEAVKVEVRGGNMPMAKALLAKALQECNDSGLLWSEAILMEPRPQRKARSADAIKKCENHPLVLITVARLFWADRKPDKARNWFNRASKSNPDLGDTWAWWLKFELEHGNKDQVEEVIQKCVEADPHHGQLWTATSKDLKNFGRKPREIVVLIASGLTNVI
ncbi:hypothetical protein HK098_005941 [Nowakowskiella sp. JEL0407]|nr:hypothetical protein HK098_005941 [Nowakowskiella sp. JEL0407]